MRIFYTVCLIDEATLIHFLSFMFRTKLVRSLVAASRCVANPAAPIRCFSACTSRAYGLVNMNSYASTILSRSFSTQPLTSKEILQRIDACGINDAGKEKIIADEVKNKNFAALREVGDAYLSFLSLIR